MRNLHFFFHFKHFLCHFAIATMGSFTFAFSYLTYTPCYFVTATIGEEITASFMKAHRASVHIRVPVYACVRVSVALFSKNKFL